MSGATSYPKSAPPLVGGSKHDLYPDIDPATALANAAHGLAVLITGAGRGCGRAEALAFAQAGATKLVLTSRSQSELDEVKQAILALDKGTDVVVHTADLTDDKSVEALFEKAGEVDGASLPSPPLLLVPPPRPPLAPEADPHTLRPQSSSTTPATSSRARRSACPTLPTGAARSTSTSRGPTSPRALSCAAPTSTAASTRTARRGPSTPKRSGSPSSTRAASGRRGRGRASRATSRASLSFSPSPSLALPRSGTHRDDPRSQRQVDGQPLHRVPPL